MSGTTNHENSFVGFEYKELTVKKTMQYVYNDSYKNFGWIFV
ncbi:MAG: hypothetical protein ACERKZ_21165 [Lachnotalea sp.]